MQSQQLIAFLIQQTESILEQIKALKNYNDAKLNWRPNKDAWSVLECIERLNRYGDFYLPAISTAMNNSELSPSPKYKAGWLGNYFANSMLPKERLNKMKTFKDKNPIYTQLDETVIDASIKQQEQLLALLQLAEQKNLNKIRIPTSISPLLKLKLGDTFRFFINHIIRHMQQIERILQAQS